MVIPTRQSEEDVGAGEGGVEIPLANPGSGAVFPEERERTASALSVIFDCIFMNEPPVLGENARQRRERVLEEVIGVVERLNGRLNRRDGALEFGDTALRLASHITRLHGRGVGYERHTVSMACANVESEWQREAHAVNCMTAYIQQGECMPWMEPLIRCTLESTDEALPERQRLRRAREQAIGRVHVLHGSLEGGPSPAEVFETSRQVAEHVREALTAGRPACMNTLVDVCSEMVTQSVENEKEAVENFLSYARIVVEAFAFRTRELRARGVHSALF